MPSVLIYSTTKVLQSLLFDLQAIVKVAFGLMLVQLRTMLPSIHTHLAKPMVEALSALVMAVTKELAVPELI